MLFLIACPGLMAQSEEKGADSELPEGETYRTSSIELQYEQDIPGLPEVERLLQVLLELGRVGEIYFSRAAAEEAGGKSVTVTLGERNNEESARGTVYHATAIRAINQQIVEYFNKKGFIGIYVSPDVDVIGPRGEDRRESSDEPIALIIRVGIVHKMRTVAAGERISQDKRENNAKHERVKERSPIQPVDEEGDPTADNVLNRDAIDRYVTFLNRHPGRQVDVAVSAAEAPGEVLLDYMVNESKPWQLYYQVSDTGTESIDKIRYRFGAVHNQLTNNDDILNLDYITTGFDDPASQAVVGSYELPAPAFPRLRGRLSGLWSEFVASDVGLAGEEFSGETWEIGGEVAWNFFQHGNLFVDFVSGVDFREVRVVNQVNQTIVARGEEQLLVPAVGFDLEAGTDTYNLNGSTRFRWSRGDYTNIEFTELEALGRTEPEKDWELLQGDITLSMFLEPLLWREAWEDASTPASSTRAHELLLSARGQWAFDNRLIPQYQDVAGGLYTVRGYPESAVAGDNVGILSAEYRLHIPRLLQIQPQPGSLPFSDEPFRWAPQEVYGQPDWDLTLKAFFDYARVVQADRQSNELDHTLYGAGVGLEFVFKRNFSARLDWGWALNEVESPNPAQPNEVDRYDSEFHFVITTFY